MEDKSVKGVHWSFWVISTIAFLWNALGSVNYFMQMDSAMLEFYRPSEQAIIVGRPAWATAGFAVGVFAGSIGGLLLLLRRSVAVYLFILSLLGVIVTMFHTINVDYDFAFGELFAFVMMPVIVAALLIWYTKHVKSRGWIR